MGNMLKKTDVGKSRGRDKIEMYFSNPVETIIICTIVITEMLRCVQFLHIYTGKVSGLNV